jgi:phosphoglycerate dehydrogenase-like enzyme
VGDQLRVAVVTPLSDELCGLVQQLEPRVEMVCEQELLPPVRYPADHHGDPSFARTPAQERRFAEIIAGADALYGVPGEDPAALRRAVETNPRLRWVHTMAAGGGALVKAAALSAEQLGRVTFTTSAGVHGGPLAEYALFGLLAGAKNLPHLQADAARHEWPDRWLMGQLREQTVLVVGLGGIGREVARLLAAFGTRVIGTSRSAERVDGVVVTLPGTAATERLVSGDVLAAVRPGATLVNVGRGTVIDEDALVGALRDGRIGFAALDVFAAEPLDPASPLWDLPNVLISPHNATLTPAEGRRIAELFADNAARLLDGRPLRNVVNTVEFY